MRNFFIALILIVPVDPIYAQYTDGARSLATGTGLQYATTGVLAQFTITAIDESGLPRTLGGDDFVVELDGTRTLSGSVRLSIIDIRAEVTNLGEGYLFRQKTELCSVSIAGR